MKLQNIVQRLEGIQETATAKPNLQKWGKGSAKVYETINGPNQEPRTELNLQANQEPLNPQANNQADIVSVIISIFLLFFFVAFKVYVEYAIFDK